MSSEETVTLVCESTSENGDKENKRDESDIEIIDISISKGNEQNTFYNKAICAENVAFTEFIDLCLNLDGTKDMKRIINTLLLPAFKNADDEYKNSVEINRVIKKAKQRLLLTPSRKYAYINDVYSTLRVHKRSEKRKRVELITLSNVATNQSNKRKSPSILVDLTPRLDIVELDDNNDDEIEVIENGAPEEVRLEATVNLRNLATEEPIEIVDSQDINKENSESVSEVHNLESNLHNERESPEIVNNETPNSIGNSSDVECMDMDDKSECNVKNQSVVLNETKKNKDVTQIEKKDQIMKRKLQEERMLNDENSLLVLQKVVSTFSQDSPTQMTEVERIALIKQLEDDIAKYSALVTKLDEEEVDLNSKNSPYILSNKYKDIIVSLYSQLCRLTGTTSRKHRDVRFRVTDGKPDGPIRRLEELLNQKMKENGVPEFPDFNDVIACVETANVEDNLGWSKEQIKNEAVTLFSYCGRNLQKRRQKREFRYLQKQIAQDAFDDDPADRDPELLAKLQRNKRTGLENENNLLKKYEELERQQKINAVKQNAEQNLSADVDMSNHNEAKDVTSATSINNVENTDETGLGVQIKVEPVEIVYKGDLNVVIEISDSSDDEDV